MSSSTDIQGLTVLDGPYPNVLLSCDYCGTEFEWDAEDLEGLAGTTLNAHDLHTA